MTPEARGTAVAIFSSAIYLGQTLGVAAGALVFDRFTAVPLFIATAVALPALAWWFAAKLRRHTADDRQHTDIGRASSVSPPPPFGFSLARGTRVRFRRAPGARPSPADSRRARS